MEPVKKVEVQDAKVLRARIAACEEKTLEMAARRELADLMREADRAEFEVRKAELEVEFERVHGPRGQAWDWVPCYSTKTPVAVKAPHALVWKRHRDSGMPTDTNGLRAILMGSKGAGCSILCPEVPEFEAMCEQEVGLFDLAGLTSIRLASAANAKLAGK